MDEKTRVLEMSALPLNPRASRPFQHFLSWRAWDYSATQFSLVRRIMQGVRRTATSNSTIKQLQAFKEVDGPDSPHCVQQKAAKRPD
jgi:hypothetical protein